MLGRIESRIASMIAHGEQLRPDDNPASLRNRLDAYRAQTAPLSGYYAGRGVLRTVDGMAPIDDVTAAIAEILGGGAGGPDTPPPRRRPAGIAAAARKTAVKRSAAVGPDGRAGGKTASRAKNPGPGG